METKNIGQLADFSLDLCLALLVTLFAFVQVFRVESDLFKEALYTLLQS